MESFKLAAIQILREANSHLHYEEITKRALEKGLIETSDSSPEATMNEQIITDIRNKKEKSAFLKIKPDIYSLNPNFSPEEEKIALEILEFLDALFYSYTIALRNSNKKIFVLVNNKKISFYDYWEEFEEEESLYDEPLSYIKTLKTLIKNLMDNNSPLDIMPDLLKTFYGRLGFIENKLR